MRSKNQHQDSNDLQQETGERELAITDFAAILAIPILLAGIHYLVPGSVKHTLAFAHDQFTLYTLLTAAYIHAGQAHLFNNILAYLLAAFYTYWLCMAANHRRWFWRTFGLLLLLLPILVSITSYTAFSMWFPKLSPVSRGFSGVTAGFAGFLLVSLAVFVRERYSKTLGNVLGSFIFLVVMATIDYIYAGRIRIIMGGLLAAGIMLMVRLSLQEVEIDLDNLERREVLIDAGYVTLGWAVLISMVIAMFPAEISQNGSTTNIVAHAMGFLLGLGTSVLTKAGERLWGSDGGEPAVSKTPE